MRSLLIAVVAAVACGAVLLAGQASSGKAEALRRAEVLQLKESVSTLQSQLAACRATLLNQFDTQFTVEAKSERTTIEHDAGCTLDWTARPPVCLEAK
jgi:outer membrane murein-binding lipoprotein Lpp